MAFSDQVLAAVSQEKTLLASIKAAIDNGLITPDVQAAILANLDENTQTMLGMPGGTPPAP